MVRNGESLRHGLFLVSRGNVGEKGLESLLVFGRLFMLLALDAVVREPDFADFAPAAGRRRPFGHLAGSGEAVRT